MPGGDRTGPMGMGPRTGRGAGFCGGVGSPGFASRGFGAGGAFGGGRGRGGRGRRNMFYATGLTGWQRAAMDAAEPPAATQPQPAEAVQQELEVLKTQAAAVAAALDQIRRRIEEIATSRPASSESAEQ